MNKQGSYSIIQLLLIKRVEITLNMCRQYIYQMQDTGLTMKLNNLRNKRASRIGDICNFLKHYAAIRLVKGVSSNDSANIGDIFCLLVGLSQKIHSLVSWDY